MLLIAFGMISGIDGVNSKKFEEPTGALILTIISSVGRRSKSILLMRLLMRLLMKLS